jgi:SAM-dependent methyltransferase
MSFRQGAGIVTGMQQHHGHGSAHGHGHGHGDDTDWGALAHNLDLDAEVLHEYLAGAMDWVQEQAAGRPVRRILDFGAGTGNATVALAERFPEADLVAVDGSAELLARITEKAGQLGLASRVSVVQADLDQPWPELGLADLAWSSNALHHLAEPGQALRQIFALLRPGGLVAVAEMTTALRFLPDDLGLGRPGLQDRLVAAQDEARSALMPYLMADWGPVITAAGFTAVAGRLFEIKLTSPLPPGAGPYAQGHLRRLAEQAGDQLPADDRAVLDQLTADDGPASVTRRQDLEIRGSRTVWTGTRP